MNRIICITAIVTSLSTMAVAQEGYKDYQWGQTVEQVSQKAGKLEEMYVMFGWFSRPQTIILYSYSDEFGNRAPDPMTHEDRPISSFAPEGTTGGGWSTPPITFWFAGGELIAVEISKFETTMLPALKDRYGQKNPISGVMSSGYQFEAVAWTSGDRMILWQIPYDGTPGSESITYLSRPWFESLLKELRAERAQNTQSDKSRLD